MEAGTACIFGQADAKKQMAKAARRLTMISVEHLTKCYGDVTAMDALSFEIDEGHVYGFLWPNGVYIYLGRKG